MSSVMGSGSLVRALFTSANELKSSVEARKAEGRSWTQVTVPVDSLNTNTIEDVRTAAIADITNAEDGIKDSNIKLKMDEGLHEFSSYLDALEKNREVRIFDSKDTPLLSRLTHRVMNFFGVLSGVRYVDIEKLTSIKDTIAPATGSLTTVGGALEEAARAAAGAVGSAVRTVGSAMGRGASAMVTAATSDTAADLAKKAGGAIVSGTSAVAQGAYKAVTSESTVNAAKAAGNAVAGGMSAMAGWVQRKVKKEDEGQQPSIPSQTPSASGAASEPVASSPSGTVTFIASDPKDDSDFAEDPAKWMASHPNVEDGLFATLAWKYLVNNTKDMDFSTKKYIVAKMILDKDLGTAVADHKGSTTGKTISPRGDILGILKGEKPLPETK